MACRHPHDPVLYRPPPPPTDADFEMLGGLLDRHGDPKTARVLAGRLLAELATLRGVIGASLPELTAVVSPLVQDPKPWLDVLVLYKAIGLRVLRQQLHRRRPLSSWQSLLNYLRLSMGQETRERFRVLFLDHCNGLICDETLGEGTVNHAPVYPREVVRRALELGCKNMILVHNHPSRSETFSVADVEMTAKVCWAATAVGIEVHDHILVSGDDVVGMKQAGLMPATSDVWMTAMARLTVSSRSRKAA